MVDVMLTGIVAVLWCALTIMTTLLLLLFVANIDGSTSSSLDSSGPTANSSPDALDSSVFPQDTPELAVTNSSAASDVSVSHSTDLPLSP